MPRHLGDSLARTLRKGVASRDRPRGGARDLRSGDARMGLPAATSVVAFPHGNGNPLNGNILVRGGRETNWDSPSSSERKGKSSNRIPRGDLWEMWGCGLDLLLTNEAEVTWNGPP